MNKILKSTSFFAFGLIMLFTSCKKDEKTNNTTPTNNNNTACQDGYVCFKLDGNSMSKAGGGYYFADTFLFVKYEDGAKQLSIDVFGNQAKDYKLSDVKQVNNARVYWFPDNNNMYMSSKGTLNVSEYSTDKMLTGTFSATLYKYDSNNSTFNMADSVVITEGFFTKVKLQ